MGRETGALGRDRDEGMKGSGRPPPHSHESDGNIEKTVMVLVLLGKPNECGT